MANALLKFSLLIVVLDVGFILLGLRQAARFCVVALVALSFVQVVLYLHH